MKKLASTLTLVFFLFLTCLVCGVSAYQTLKETAMTSQGTIPLVSGPLLDNFDNGTGVNLWGGTTGALAKSGSGATIVASYPEVSSSTAFGAGNHSLQLTYNVTPADSWAAYVTSLGLVGISDYNYLSLWVKGTVGGEYFKLELHTAGYDPSQSTGYNNNYKGEVYITDYLDGGVTTAWQKVTIPLDAFANINNRTSIKELVITFEGTQSTDNGSPASSAVYIDNISFGKQFLGFVRVDHFGDKYSKNALGGNCSSAYPPGQGVLGTFTYTNVADQYVDFANGLDFYFQNDQDPNYYSYVSTVGGGDAGNVAQPRNFTAYNNISFFCKANASNVRCLKLELHCPTSDSNYFHFFKYTFTTLWQKVTIPFAEFTTNGWAGQGTSIVAAGKVDSIGEIVFTRDGWMSYWSGDWDYGVYYGHFYIDKVQFEVDGYVPDATVPSAPTNISTSTNGNIVTFTVTASSGATDPSIENVRVEYYYGGLWRAIGYDYDTSDNAYIIKWDTSGLPAATYTIRAIAMDAGGRKSANFASTYVKS